MDARFFKLFFIVAFSCTADCALEQHEHATTYVVAGEPVTLVCTPPGLNDLLLWKFVGNGSTTEQDVAQYYPGGKITIFDQFNIPPERSELINGLLTIKKVSVPDEGHYWCEISQLGQTGVSGDRFPVHVWVAPQEPSLTPHGNGTVLEHTQNTVATCSSMAGKPEAKLSWWNGSNPLSTSARPLVTKDKFSDSLFDASLDLVLENPTRFDHRRNFTCRVEHPAYKDKPKSLNHAVNVLYHPVNARIWANLTSLMVYCEADGYEAPKYNWVIPEESEVLNSSSVHIANLYDLPGNAYLECTAHNSVPPAAVARVDVDALRWPDGKPIPSFAGLVWYIWAGIGAGVLLLIIVVIVVICCCCCKKNEKGSDFKAKKKTGVKAKYSKPLVTSSGLNHSQPSLLEFDSLRTPDGRESSVPRNDHNHTKAAMARTYSLDHVVDEKFAQQGRDSVMLVPLNDLPRKDPYNDSSQRGRGSSDQIHQLQEQPLDMIFPYNTIICCCKKIIWWIVADHIEVLNKSWDNLARSRENLSRSRQELHVELPPKYESHEFRHQQPSHSRADDQESYPYMDDTMNTRDNRRANSYPNPDYYQHEVIPQHGYNTDGSGYGDASNGYRGNNDDYRGNNEGYHDNNDGYRGNNDDYRGNSGGYGDNNDDYSGNNARYPRNNDGYHGNNEHQSNPQYEDGYNTSGDDYHGNQRQYHLDNQNYEQSQYNGYDDGSTNYNRGGNYDDRSQEGYDDRYYESRGYQPPSMI